MKLSFHYKHDGSSLAQTIELSKGILVTEPVSTPLPILVLIDVQNGFVKRSTTEIPGRIAEFLGKHADKFGNIVATRFYNPEDSNYETLIGWSKLRSSEETAIAPEILPWITEEISKPTYTAIPQILAVADRAGTRDIVFCGIDTDVCVLQNAAGVFDAGYRPTIIYDLCATGGGDDAHRSAYPLLCRTIGTTQVVCSADYQD